MNKQVRKLALEATSYQWIPGMGTLVDFDQELFARLILAECVTVLKDHKCMTAPCGQRSGNILKEHFGVEE